MSTFADEVRSDAIRCGWAPEVADALARYTGNDRGAKPPRPVYPKGKAPRACAPGFTVADMVRACGLPSAVSAEFFAAGVTTAAAATPLLKDHFQATVRYGAAAAAAGLRLHLTARAIYQRTKTQ